MGGLEKAMVLQIALLHVLIGKLQNLIPASCGYSSYICWSKQVWYDGS